MMFGRNAEVEAKAKPVPEWTPPRDTIEFGLYNPRKTLHLHLLRDFEVATEANDEAVAVLRHAEQVAAQAATALVEARKQMRRVAEGTI